MTTVTIDKGADGNYSGFAVDGHTGYAVMGNDVACAAVSVLTINTINSIESLTSDGDKLSVTTNEEEGIIRCRFTAPLSEGSELLMGSFELGVSEISARYGSDVVRVRVRE